MFDLRPLSAALTASIIGFGGTLALIIAAAQAVGATQAQTASWFTAICLAIAVESAVLSWRYRMPVVSAYSTAGAALIGASTGVSIETAVGAFIVAAVLLIITGLIRPLTLLVARIPQQVAAAMLAGILIAFPMNAARLSVADPVLLLPLVAFFFLFRIINASLAAIAVLMAGIAWAAGLGRIAELPTLGLAHLEWITPGFDPAVALGLGVPLYLVTMASQNLPGLAVLNANNYHPPAGPLISFTGLMSLLSAPFAASTTNLSAITAAICIGPDAHPDPAKRWVTGLWYAGCYAVFAAFGASITGVISALPAALIALIAGLALLSSLTGALQLALGRDEYRFPAVVTLTVTASGVAVFGVGAPFWGLMAGLVVAGLQKFIK
ncbi:MAG: benzoate/H(+) symporter BenE family transporter [Rhizobiaceae bacterium]|jgi:benzoate membrane transport protein|nr:benzoate/H(+) symporter BenE family transporter [Rhizobiaceae bacterium]